MGLFSLDYQNVPGQGVYARGALEFHADEEALRRYFAPLLHYVALNDLIGEAAFWCLLPRTLGVWSLPFLLHDLGVLFAILVTICIVLLAKMLHRIIYFKPLNYLVFIANFFPILLLAYVVWGLMFGFSGSVVKIVALGVYIFFYVLGIDELLFGVFSFLATSPIVPIGRIYYKKTGKFPRLPTSDQNLRNVCWHYARKLGISRTKWVVYDHAYDDAVKRFDIEKKVKLEPLIVALRGEIGMAAALDRVGDDTRAVDQLILTLEKGTPDVRRKAAYALRQIGDPRATEPLIAALKDQDSLVRWNAAEALGKITAKGFGQDAAKWQKWWEQNNETVLK